MDFQLTDRLVFEITSMLYTEFNEQQTKKKLDLDHLTEFKNQHIKPLYPRKQIVGDNGQIHYEKYPCSQFCCDITPGNFFCGKTTDPHYVYQEFGLGICIYSKFMKHLILLLGILSLLALIPISLYYIVAVNHQRNITESYSSVLLSGTIGIVSASYIECGYAMINNQTAQFNLGCPVGIVNLIGPTLTNQSKNSVSNCRLEHKNYIENISKPSDYLEVKNCINDTYCQIAISALNPSYSGNQYEYLSYNYQCIESQYPIGQLMLTDDIILYIVTIVDLLIIIITIIFMICESRSESKEINKFREHYLAVHDFTVSVHEFSMEKIEQQLQEFLGQYEQIRKSEEMQQKPNQNQFVESIVQIKIFDSKEVRQKIQKRRKIYQKLFDLLSQCFFNQNIDVTTFNNHTDFIQQLYGSPETPEYQQYKKCLTNQIQKYVQSKKQAQNQRFKKGSAQSEAYFIFSSLKSKNDMIHRSQKRCFKDYIDIRDKTYYLEHPPVADMILWENKSKWTCLRVLFSVIVTFAIYGGSYLLVGYAQMQKQILKNNYSFQQQCNDLFTPSQLSTYISTLEIQDSYYHCYCNQQLYQVYTNNFELDSRCNQWLNSFILYQLIPILISIGIVLYNVIVSRIFKFLSKFQAHSDITTELYSYIIKRSFLLILNMGLILIILNMDFSIESTEQQFNFLFLGTYTDISSDWYYNIGVVIIITLCINIFLPIFELILESFLQCLRKTWDTKCCTVRTSKKTKKQYIDLYANDVFPIQERYADMISIVVIIFLFSAVMPFVYIIGLLSIGFLALTDKVLLFRVYQKPINYTSNLQDKIFKIFYFILIIHCVVSPLFFSSIELQQANQKFQTLLESIQLGQYRFTYIFQTPYLIIYVFIFGLLVLWAIIYLSFVQLCSFCIEKYSKRISLYHEDKLNATFLHSLNNYQLNRLKASLEKQIDEIDQISRDRASMNFPGLQNSIKNIYLIQQIAINSLKEIDKILRMPQKQRKIRNKQMTLIGRAGYDQLFDDDVNFRDKKIKLLDKHLKNFFKKQKNGKNIQIDDLEEVNERQYMDERDPPTEQAEPIEASDLELVVLELQ